jgi:hypothetical protein
MLLLSQVSTPQQATSSWPTLGDPQQGLGTTNLKLLGSNCSMLVRSSAGTTAIRQFAAFEFAIMGVLQTK